MLKKLYLIFISTLLLGVALKADEVVYPQTENEEKAPVEDVDLSDEESPSTDEPLKESGDESSSADATLEVPESELIEMAGYSTAVGSGILGLKLDDSDIAALTVGLRKGLIGEKKVEDIPQESIEAAFQQAQMRAEALVAESEEIPVISEDDLQIIGLVLLEQSGLSYLGFGAEDADLIISGFTVGANVDRPDSDIEAKLPAFQKFMQERLATARAIMTEEAKVVAAERVAAGEAFFEELSADPDVQKSESGLYYKILEPGADEKPTMEDSVLVHYKGTLIDGTEFDSSYKRDQPAKFPLNGVVKGFGEGLTKIGAGGKIILYIPSELGYGDSPRPGGLIKPGDTLIFECELIEVNP
jgi:FKBP-type peptidyl-prolyl cis-trans isomerase